MGRTAHRERSAYKSNKAPKHLQDHENLLGGETLPGQRARVLRVVHAEPRRLQLRITQPARRGRSAAPAIPSTADRLAVGTEAELDTVGAGQAARCWAERRSGPVPRHRATSPSGSGSCRHRSASRRSARRRSSAQSEGAVRGAHSGTITRSRRQRGYSSTTNRCASHVALCFACGDWFRPSHVASMVSARVVSMDSACFACGEAQRVGAVG
eukprot:SAG11_NODE_1543_length_4716_cov_6.357375_3_plen_212_part_00